jgi:hypothetical protein
METQANKKRVDYTFKIGDLVVLRLQPYRQQFINIRTSQKLAKRFFGPLKVIKRIGTLAYELDLPSESRIHPVFHVSLLRPYFGEEPNTHFRSLPSDQTEVIWEERKDEKREATVVVKTGKDKARE